MPPANTKANYKTYEAQARMVRALVAAHPEVKWNYKEIVACYGSDMSEHALNHRFRRLRACSIIIREGRKQGLDMRDLDAHDLPAAQDAVDKKNIAKYFGQSTADGIQFQFRSIKKDADHLRQVERDGGNVAGCLSLGGSSNSLMSTPSKPTPSRGTGSRTGTGRRRRTRVPEIKRTSSDEEEEEEDGDQDAENWSGRDETPSKRLKTGAFPGQRNGTPSRRAAARANVTIAEAAAQLDASDSQPEADTPTAATMGSAPAPAPAFPTTSALPLSIFGNVDWMPPGRDALPLGSFHSSAFNRRGSDAYLTSGLEDPDNYYIPMHNRSTFHGDGEI